MARTGSRSLHAYWASFAGAGFGILIPILTAAVAAVAFSLHQQKRYQASARVVIAQQSRANASGQEPPATTAGTDSQVAIARAPAVAGRALRSLHLHDRSPQDLVDQTAVTAGGSSVMTFTVTDRYQALATPLANAYARQFIRYSQMLGTASVRAAPPGPSVTRSDVTRHPWHGGLGSS